MPRLPKLIKVREISAPERYFVESSAAPRRRSNPTNNISRESRLTPRNFEGEALRRFRPFEESHGSLLDALV